MSFSQDDIINLNVFNADTLQKKALKAIVFYLPLQSAALLSWVPTSISQFFDEEITEHTQFGFYQIISYYPILSI